MARWRAETYRDVKNFDGCGFGKYWVVSFRLALLMPLKPSHNLLVRGSNHCGGTRKNCGLRIAKSNYKMQVFSSFHPHLVTLTNCRVSPEGVLSLNTVLQQFRS